MLLPEAGYTDTYLDFSLETIRSPRNEGGDVQRGIVARAREVLLDCWDTYISDADLEKRVLDSDAISLAHQDGRVMAFVAVRHFSDLEIEGRREHIAVVQIAIARYECRRFGVTSRALAMALLEPLRRRSGGLPRRFDGMTVVARTQSKAALSLGQGVLSGVVAPGYRPEARHQAVIDTVGALVGWESDDWNIQPRAFGYPESDQRLNDLKDHEAFVIAGDFTTYRWARLQALFHVRYPLRYRAAKKLRRRSTAVMPLPVAAEPAIDDTTPVARAAMRQMVDDEERIRQYHAEASILTEAAPAASGSVGATTATAQNEAEAQASAFALPPPR